MENLKIIEKLKDKANISYEEAKIVLEKSNWDILDAMLYLEDLGKIQKPSVSIYFTNEYNEDHKVNKNEIEKSYKSYKRENSFEGFFEEVCKIIDRCNNIFWEIKRDGRVIIKLPLTVMILLIIFTFWISIPVAICALFFGIEFSLRGPDIDTNEVNRLFKSLSNNIEKIKEYCKKGYKND